MRFFEADNLRASISLRIDVKHTKGIRESMVPRVIKVGIATNRYATLIRLFKLHGYEDALFIEFIPANVWAFDIDIN